MGLRPGHSAVGSASALGAEGREFESRCPDQLDLPIHQELTPDGFFFKKTPKCLTHRRLRILCLTLISPAENGKTADFAQFSNSATANSPFPQAAN